MHKTINITLPPNLFLKELDNPLLAIRYEIQPQLKRQELVGDVFKGIYTDIRSVREVRNEQIILMRELLKNARWHGRSKDKEIYITALIGPGGFAQGVSDREGYFARSDIKEKFENRIPIPSRNPKEKFIGGNMGTDVTYSLSKHIHVDTQTETLFCLSNTEEYDNSEDLKKRILSYKGPDKLIPYTKTNYQLFT